MATLAEWRAQKAGSRKTLPTKARRISTDLTLLADLGRLDARKAELDVEAQVLEAEHAKANPRPTADDEQATPRPRKASQKVPPPPPRLAEIEAELVEIRDEAAALYDRIRESEGELLIRGLGGGEWQMWKDAHPPRVIGHHETTRTVGDSTETTKGQPIYHPDDHLMTRYGPVPLCNATDLRTDLGRFIVSWEGEEFGEDEWDAWSADKVAPGDLRVLVNDVMELCEQSGIRAPKAPTSPATPSASDA